MIDIEEIIHQMMPTLEKPYADLFLKKVDLLVRQSFQREIVLRSKQEPARIRLCIQIAHERWVMMRIL